MSFKYESGLHNVGSYRVSGSPYISGSATLAAGSEDSYSFPNVTKSITVTNYGSEDIYVSFNSISDDRVEDGLHYVNLSSAGDSFTFNVKCVELYVSAPATNGGTADYRVFAELTHISTARMYELTGSGLTD